MDGVRKKKHKGKDSKLILKIRTPLSMNSEEKEEITRRAGRYDMTLAEYAREAALNPNDFIDEQENRPFDQVNGETERIAGRTLVQRLSTLYKLINQSLTGERISFSEDEETIRFESDKFILVYKRKQ
jgi:hypothetical protein